MAGVTSERSAKQPATTHGLLEGREDMAGLLVLALAQLLSIFGFWMGYYPAAFNLPGRSALTIGLAIFFLGAGAFGFYLAFVYLTTD